MVSSIDRLSEPGAPLLAQTLFIARSILLCSKTSDKVIEYRGSRGTVVSDAVFASYLQYVGGNVEFCKLFPLV
jgi:hypothetical protein